MGSGFDHLVLTASNEGQAEAYRSELKARDPAAAARTLVVPDPQGRRVGSGLSTLVALAELAGALRRGGKTGSTTAGLFRAERVLIIHCGGDSRRLPAYAAHGKIFAPLPIQAAGHAPALFDLIDEDLARIPLPPEGRVVVATGDVFLDIGAHPLGFERPGVIGVAWASTPERGSRHGVYVCDDRGRITGFVHKPSRAAAERAGALRPDGAVLVDTGVVCLDPATVDRWLACAGMRPDGALGPGLLRSAAEGTAPTIDLYGDMLPAIARHESLHAADWRADGAFSAAIVPTCAFLHIGSSRELLDALTDEPPADARFRRHIRARLPQAPAPWAPPAGACIHNSVLEAEPSIVGEGVVVESSHLRSAPSLPGSNIVVGVPRELGAPVSLPPGLGLVCLPVSGEPRGGWVALCFGHRDDFKTPASRGGTFGNRPLAEWLADSGLDAHDLWPGLPEEEHTLWGARLWVRTEAPAMLDPLAWILRAERAPEAWKRARRLAAPEVMSAVDHARLLEARSRVLGCV